MTYPLIGNYGRLVADDQSVRPWLRGLVVANATAAVLETPASSPHLLRGCGHPRDRRRRHPGAGPPPPRDSGSHRGHHHRPRRDRPDAGGRRRGRAVPRWEDQDFVGQVSPAAIVEVGGSTSGPARRGRRLRPQGEHRARAAAPRRARPGPAAHGRGRRSRWRPTSPGVVLSPGPGDPARLDGPVALARAVIADGRPLLGICLGHQIVAAGGGRRDAPAAVRPPRRQPPGPGPRLRPRPGDRPEPRGPGRRRVAARRRRASSQPAQPQRRLGRGAAPPRAADRDRPVPPRGLAGPARRARGLRPLPGRVRAAG